MEYVECSKCGDTTLGFIITGKAYDGGKRLCKKCYDKELIRMLR